MSIGVDQTFKRVRDLPELLIKWAIRRAKDIWKADIIVMPFGFESINRDIMRAIDETNHARILVFPRRRTTETSEKRPSRAGYICIMN